MKPDESSKPETQGKRAHAEHDFCSKPMKSSQSSVKHITEQSHSLSALIDHLTAAQNSLGSKRYLFLALCMDLFTSAYSPWPEPHVLRLTFDLHVFTFCTEHSVHFVKLNVYSIIHRQNHASMLNPKPQYLENLWRITTYSKHLSHNITTFAVFYPKHA